MGWGWGWGRGGWVGGLGGWQHSFRSRTCGTARTVGFDAATAVGGGAVVRGWAVDATASLAAGATGDATADGRDAAADGWNASAVGFSAVAVAGDLSGAAVWAVAGLLSAAVDVCGVAVPLCAADDDCPDDLAPSALGFSGAASLGFATAVALATAA